MKNTFAKYLGVLTVVSLTAGCTPTVPLQPGAEYVKIGLISAPAGCNLLGTVSSEEVNGWAGYMSGAQMLHNELNNIRNSAIRLNANYVEVTKHTVIYGKHAGGTITMEDTHFMQGNAYSCNSAAYEKIPVREHSALVRFTGDK